MVCAAFEMDVKLRINRKTPAMRNAAFMGASGLSGAVVLFIADRFQRDNLDWQSRELATIAALACISGLNPQLRAHFGIGMNTGLTPAQLEAVVAVLSDRVGAEVGANAGEVLKTVLNARNN